MQEEILILIMFLMKIQKPYGLMVGQVIFVFLWIYMAGKQMARLRGDFWLRQKIF